jgi:hypothetical protein
MPDPGDLPPDAVHNITLPYPGSPSLGAVHGTTLTDMPNEVLFNIIENIAVDTEWPQAFDLDIEGTPWDPGCERARENAVRENTLKSL